MKKIPGKIPSIDLFLLELMHLSVRNLNENLKKEAHVVG